MAVTVPDLGGGNPFGGIIVGDPATASEDNVNIAKDSSGSSSGGVNAPRVQGNSSSSSPDVGDPVKIGGVYRVAGQPLTNGQRGDVNLTQIGDIRAALVLTDGSGVGSGRSDTDAQAVQNGNSLSVVTRSYLFNGTTWDRMYGSTSGLFVQGPAGNGVAVAGNPNIIGARAGNTAPAAVGDGQAVYIRANQFGHVFATLGSPSTGTAVSVGAPNADGLSSNTVTLGTQSFPYGINGAGSFDRLRTIQGADGTGLGVNAIATAPHSSAAGAIAPIVAVAVSSLVIKASASNLYGASMTAGTTAGFLIAYNAVSAPAGGAALTAGLTLGVVPVAANGFASIGDFQIPDRFGVGIVLLFSTSTTTYTVPATPALHMRGKAQ